MNLVTICLHSLSFIDWSSPLVIAPHLRRFIHEAAYFPNALAQSTNVVNTWPVEQSGCTYARCVQELAVEDGRPPRVIIPDAGRFMRLPRVLPERLSDAGYAVHTHMRGYFRTFLNGALDPDDVRRLDAVLANDLPFDDALARTNEHTANNSPFALLFQLPQTHRPWGMAEHPWFRIRMMELEGREVPPDDDVAGARWSAIHEPDALAYARRLGLAYADRAVGRILTAIDEAGARESTAVVVYSNHGEVFDHFRNTHRLKSTCVSHGDVMTYDALEHTFQAWRIPGVSPGWFGHRTRVIDVVPTIADVLGLPPEPADGRSVRPLWEDPTSERQDARESLCLSPHAYSFRSGQYKLYACDNDDAYHRRALFDMSWDRAERHDLWGSPSHQGVIEALSRRLTDILRGREGLA